MYRAFHIEWNKKLVEWMMVKLFFIIQPGRERSYLKKFGNRWFRKIFQFIIVLIAILLLGQFLLKNSSISYRKGIHRVGIHKLNAYDLVLIKGESYRLKVFSINIWHKYSSSDFRIVEVDFKGNIYALQPGKAFVTVNVGEKTLKCRVRVIEINKEKVILKVGESKRLRVRGIVASVKWYSSNPEVATISSNGKIKAIGKGRTTISATVKGKTLNCIVVIK